MKPSVEQIGNLLAQTPTARPEEGYWQDFLQEFHQRQRLEVAKKGSFGLWFEKTSAWFAEYSPSRWAYGAGLAYATATIAFIVVPRTADVDHIPASNINHQILAAPALEQLEQLDLNPSTQGNAGEQVF